MRMHWREGDKGIDTGCVEGRRGATDPPGKLKAGKGRSPGIKKRGKCDATEVLNPDTKGAKRRGRRKDLDG